jgi:hypothetical protein
MGDKRTDQALARIDRALARIEAVASRPAPAAAPPADESKLREAHLALRSKVETAIRQIDQLLISAERG